MKKAVPALFITGLILCLVQVWLPAYYTTGDGPCHVYNAQVLHDLWSNTNTAFYSRFYELPYHPNPNWTSHLVLAALMFVVNGVVAEKILITVYAALFVSGLFVLLKRLSGGNPYWPLLAFTFVFNHLLAKGFYNFTLSIAFFFWFVEIWLRYLEGRQWKNIVLFLFLTFCTFFTHPLAFVYGCVACFALTGTFAISNGAVVNSKAKWFVGNVSVLALLLAPCIMLVLLFMNAEGGVGGVTLRFHGFSLEEMYHLNALANSSQKEDIFLYIEVIMLLVLFVSALGCKIGRRQGIHKYDGLLVLLLFVAIVNSFFPDDLFGGGLVHLRSQLFIFILAVCCIAYLFPYKRFINVCGIAMFLLFVCLSAVWISVRLRASAAVAEYVSAVKYIAPGSVVLPLDFSPNGKDEHGNVIGDRNYLFTHSAQYMGAEKPLIILDNYEANKGYFPLTWREQANPYRPSLYKFEGFEGNPPYADIEGYKQATGITIDYVLMWCYDSTALQNEHFREFYDSIGAHYRKVYTSPAARSILYARNQ
jgi:hypothetical protein